MTTQARQIKCELEKMIKGKPEEIFPMLCPVLEEKWIPGWEYKLIHSKSGFNETGCIFQEDFSGTHYFEEPVTATWLTILHDRTAGKVKFIIYYENRALAETSVGIDGTDEGFSCVRWNKVLTLIDPATERFTDEDLKQKGIDSLGFIAENLAIYFESD